VSPELRRHQDRAQLSHRIPEAPGQIGEALRSRASPKLLRELKQLTGKAGPTKQRALKGILGTSAHLFGGRWLLDLVATGPCQWVGPVQGIAQLPQAGL